MRELTKFIITYNSGIKRIFEKVGREGFWRAIREEEDSEAGIPITRCIRIENPSIGTIIKAFGLNQRGIKVEKFYKEDISHKITETLGVNFWAEYPGGVEVVFEKDNTYPDRWSCTKKVNSEVRLISSKIVGYSHAWAIMNAFGYYTVPLSFRSDTKLPVKDTQPRSFWLRGVKFTQQANPHWWTVESNTDRISVHLPLSVPTNNEVVKQAEKHWAWGSIQNGMTEDLNKLGNTNEISKRNRLIYFTDAGVEYTRGVDHWFARGNGEVLVFKVPGVDPSESEIVTAFMECEHAHQLLPREDVPKRTSLEQVKEFHEKFGHPVHDRVYISDEKLNHLRLKLFREELQELDDALRARNAVEVLDGLSDLQVVLDGAFLALGFHKIKDEAVAETHKSNMSKLGKDGKPIYREDGKILKGPDFKEPDYSKLLNKI